MIKHKLLNTPGQIYNPDETGMPLDLWQPRVIAKRILHRQFDSPYNSSATHLMFPLVQRIFIFSQIFSNCLHLFSALQPLLYPPKFWFFFFQVRLGTRLCPMGNFSRYFPSVCRGTLYTFAASEMFNCSCWTAWMASHISWSLHCFHFFRAKSVINTAVADADRGWPLLACLFPPCDCPWELRLPSKLISVLLSVYWN